VDLTYYYPHLTALTFLAGICTTKIRDKKRFLVRVIGALLVALFLAHVNRLFHIWPRHLYFASGHMTFSLSMALALGLLRPWTLWVTLPLLVPFGFDLVILRFHKPEDVIGAVLLVVAIFGLANRYWGLERLAAPLDSAKVSS
jgi:membrane-associated phospholipid phosphatase